MAPRRRGGTVDDADEQIPDHLHRAEHHGVACSVHECRVQHREEQQQRHRRLLASIEIGAEEDRGDRRRRPREEEGVVKPVPGHRRGEKPDRRADERRTRRDDQQRRASRVRVSQPSVARDHRDCRFGHEDAEPGVAQAEAERHVALASGRAADGCGPAARGPRLEPRGQPSAQFCTAVLSALHVFEEVAFITYRSSSSAKQSRWLLELSFRRCRVAEANRAGDRYAHARGDRQRCVLDRERSASDAAIRSATRCGRHACSCPAARWGYTPLGYLFNRWYTGRLASISVPTS